MEHLYCDLVSEVKSNVQIPVAVKLGPYFSSMGNMARKLDAARADALVLFNRFYQPDFDLEALEVTLAANRVKLLVLTPDFQNPTGTSMPLASRRRVMELAARHQVPVVEDHIYARLNTQEERIPSLKQLDRTNLVIHIDSFAKVAFPGLRVGWIVAPPAAIERLRLV